MEKQAKVIWAPRAKRQADLAIAYCLKQKVNHRRKYQAIYTVKFKESNHYLNDPKTKPPPNKQRLKPKNNDPDVPTKDN